MLSRRQFIAVGGAVVAEGLASTSHLLGQQLPSSQLVAQSDDPLCRWRGKLSIHPVAPNQNRHSIHSYFNTCPESPDGNFVLYYTSDAADGQTGDIRILERATGKERIIATNIHTEDAHRVACQQWISNGKRVVFHDFRKGTTCVVVVDLDSGKERVLAWDRLVWWGVPTGDIVPIYGKQWDPGNYRDLYLLNVVTGEIQTPTTAAAVREKYPEGVTEWFGDKPISICFPALSPDSTRIFFKLAHSNIPPNGNFRAITAVEREGLVGYDLRQKDFLFYNREWGHPAWLSDSVTISNIGPVLINSNTGIAQSIPGVPKFPGSHPSVMPDSKLFITDTTTENFGGSKSIWGVAVGDIHGYQWKLITNFDGSHGATTWRHNHPHPVTNSLNNRIYFNVNATQWTQLYVAEI